MHIVMVSVCVKSDQLEEFRQATIENAKDSLNEPGVIRFDVLQMADDPTRFILEEIYHTPEDQIKHRETPHYNTWKDKVAGMMAEPRKGIKFLKIYPED